MAPANNAPAKEAAAKQQAASPANVYRNKAGRTETLVSAPITINNTQNNTQEELPNCCEDIESIKGKFSYQSISGIPIPYIIRIINGELLKFVSVHMAETQLLKNYLPYLHENIYECISVIRSHYITDSEARLLNIINQIHTDCTYGKEMYVAGKDHIVSLEDIHEFYMFMEVCHKKLMCNITSGSIEKCGFIRINSDSVVPYCIKDNQKVVPIFFFETDTLNLEDRAVKLEKWNLAYLKFCFKVQGIRNELYTGNYCLVVNFDDIKNYYPPETNFEEYWPSKAATKLLIKQKLTHVNSRGTWFRASSEIAPAENTKGWPSNQLGSNMSQDSSLINSESHVVPPLVHVGNTAPIIGNTISYSNAAPINQCTTTMNNPMTNGNVMLHSSQMSQVHPQCSINSQAQQQQLQQRQIITTPKTRMSYSGQSVRGRCTNTRQRYTLRSTGPIVTTPPSEIIDLTSPSPPPVSSLMLENYLTFNIELKLKRIPERIVDDPLNIVAYKIQRKTLQGKIISCINTNPYIYSDLMVPLDNLVQMVLPSCTVTTCAFLLNNYLKTELLSGNSEQLALLRKNKLIKSKKPDDTPLAMLPDVMYVLQQLKALVFMLNERIEQKQSSEGRSKRRRII